LRKIKELKLEVEEWKNRGGKKMIGLSGFATRQKINRFLALGACGVA